MSDKRINMLFRRRAQRPAGARAASSVDMGEAIVRDLQEGLPVRVRGMNDPEEAERELEHRRIRMIVRMPPDFSAKAASTSIKKPAPRTSAAGAAQPKMN